MSARRPRHLHLVADDTPAADEPKTGYWLIHYANTRRKVYVDRGVERDCAGCVARKARPVATLPDDPN